ncbi:GNAT family N-acetyltransferase [Spirosoma areae]
MDRYTILLQDNPQSSDIPAFCQNGFFFNENEHLRQQRGGRFRLLTALNQRTGKSEGRCAFFIQSPEALSPKAAPFGSIEFAETLPNQVLDAYIIRLIEETRCAGATLLRLVNYPDCYAPKQAQRLAAILTEHGFRVSQTNPTFFLPISDGSFVSQIAPSEQRRLRKCQKSGFQFMHWQTPPIGEVLKFIEEVYQQKGYRFTIEPKHLIRLLDRFPAKFLVFVVKDGPSLTALAVTVRVRNDILYNFLPVSYPAYSTFSPMVMLIDGLFTYC